MTRITWFGDQYLGGIGWLVETQNLDFLRFPNVPFSKRQIFKLFFASELFGHFFSIFEVCGVPNSKHSSWLVVTTHFFKNSSWIVVTTRFSKNETGNLQKSTFQTSGLVSYETKPEVWRRQLRNWYSGFRFDYVPWNRCVSKPRIWISRFHTHRFRHLSHIPRLYFHVQQGVRELS